MSAIEIIEIMQVEPSREPSIRVGRPGDGAMADLTLRAASPDERRALLGQLLLAAANAGVGPGAL